jgi:hypothetical protein
VTDLFTASLPPVSTEFQTLDEAINFCGRMQVETGNDWRIFGPDDHVMPPPYIVRIADQIL